AAPWPKKLSKEQNSPPSIGTGLDPFAQPPKDFVEDSDLRFRGYWLDKNKRPIFRYEWHDLRVRDEFKPVGEHDLYVIQRTLTFTGAGRGWFRIARSPKIDKLNERQYRIIDRWTLTVNTGTAPTLRQSEGEWELIMTVREDYVIDLTYDW